MDAAEKNLRWTEASAALASLSLAVTGFGLPESFTTRLQAGALAGAAYCAFVSRWYSRGLVPGKRD